MVTDDVQLPRYRSHKIVNGGKITSIHRLADSDEAFLDLTWPGGATTVKVTGAYMRKHDPQVGGYWVRYEDGYQSWSPAEAFEGGYTLVSEVLELHREYMLPKGLTMDVTVTYRVPFGIQPDIQAQLEQTFRFDGWRVTGGKDTGTA